MRLFTALLPPDGVRAELLETVRRLRRLPGADGLRWAQPPGWHCTLAFYGEIDEAQYEGLAERLGRAAARSAPQRLRVAGGGRFGDRVLWAGLAAASCEVDETPDGCGEGAPGGTRPELLAVRRLAQASTAAGQRVGLVVPDVRRFTPHVTLARGRGGADLAAFVEALADTCSTPWTADELALVRSKLPVSGHEGEQPRYETVRAWPLGRRP